MCNKESLHCSTKRGGSIRPSFVAYRDGDVVEVRSTAHILLAMLDVLLHVAVQMSSTYGRHLLSTRKFYCFPFVVGDV